MENNTEQVNLPRQKLRQRWIVLIIFAVVAMLLAGFLRVYHGGGLGFHIVAKDSFSFSDTIVNLDNILGQPRLVVMLRHPDVVRQLEEMGIIETLEQAIETLEQASEQIMREIDEAIEGDISDNVNLVGREHNGTWSLFEWKQDELGLRYLTGTVANRSSNEYSFVQIDFYLYDKTGAQVGSTSAFISNLEPYGTWKFEALVLEENAVRAKFKGVTGF
ncbi:hypothetical protein CMI37_23685 [Candidatus Pacearchaeota archaeon]|nr:hypothetical protein [Candidatus Pacearchaeota archaeon]|tara:strand:+ start:1900 stop:2553 length:654 start_codon:yes stop_codon:yes gene_type:complete